jgi:serine protease
LLLLKLLKIVIIFPFRGVMHLPLKQLFHVAFILLAAAILSLPMRADSSYQLLGTGVSSAAEMKAERDSQETDQIIIKFSAALEGQGRKDGKAVPPGKDLLAKLSKAAGVELRYLREISGESFVIQLPGKMPLDRVRNLTKRLEAAGLVEYAVPDLILLPAYVPSDPEYKNQWHYFAPSSGYFGINLPSAWDLYPRCCDSTVVAVLDTGITNHSDLNARVVQGYDFVSDLSAGDDGDGRDGDPSDPGDGCNRASSWHGTHVAGTIGAVSNNGRGVAGVGWNARILPVRVLGKCGGNTSDVMDGIRWAAGLPVPNVPVNRNPAKVLNLSLGGSGTCPTNDPIQKAINDVTAAGVTVVVAAGNSNVAASSFYPANCSGVITVGATDKSGSKAWYSNYDSTVEISAPGGDTNSYLTGGILSTSNSGYSSPSTESYTYLQGTSMAAPHVAGVVAMMYSLNPYITPAQVLQQLQNTVTKFPAGSSCTTSICGAGILNAGAVVAPLVQTHNGTCTSTYLPIIEQKNTQQNASASLYIVNQTNGTLCYEVYGTSIGEKCSGVGKSFYGTFESGTYQYKATGCGGYLNMTAYYPPGVSEHSFVCTSGEGSNSGDVFTHQLTGD